MGCGSSTAAAAEAPAAPAVAPIAKSSADNGTAAETKAADPPKAPSGPSTAEKKEFEQRIIDIYAKGQARAEDEARSPKRDAFLQSVKEIFNEAMGNSFPPEGVAAVTANLRSECEMLRDEPNKAAQLEEIEEMVLKLEAKQDFEQRIRDIEGTGQAAAEEDPLSPKRDQFMQSIKEMYEAVMCGEFPADGMAEVISNVKSELEMLRGEPKKAAQFKELEGMVAKMEVYHTAHREGAPAAPEGAPAAPEVAPAPSPAAPDGAAAMKASIAANVARRAAEAPLAAAPEDAPSAAPPAANEAAAMKETIAPNVAEQAAEAAAESPAEAPVVPGDEADDTDSGSDEEDEVGDEKQVEFQIECEINPCWKVYRSGKFKAVSTMLPKNQKVRVYNKRMVLKVINELNKLKAKADKADDREDHARATMQEMVEQMMCQKYGTGVYKARKHLSLLKTVHAFAKVGGKREDLPEAVLLSKGLQMGGSVDNSKIIKISDTYAAERKEISKDKFKAVFIKADRVEDVLGALRPEGGNQDAELAAAAGLPKLVCTSDFDWSTWTEETEGDAHVSWARLVLISSLTAQY